MPIKRILVTGSSGTIGTRLCEKLTERGYHITGLDTRTNKWSKTVNNITILADLRDKAALDRLPKDVDMIIHLAANARVYDLVLRPDLAKDNFDMLFNILEFCRLNKIKRFIFASSREVYGNTNQHNHSEDEAYVRNCESPYTASKIGGEALVHSYGQCYGIDFIIIRFSNVYGMYDDSDRVVPLFIRHAKENREIVVYGKDKFLDFTYIDDAVSGVRKCIEKFNQVKNDVFNIAYGKGIGIAEMGRLVKEHMCSKSGIKLKENRKGEVVKFVADISKAKQKLGYVPRTSIEEGIKKSIEWYGNVSK
jgi:nucleoside-diphosphate-sugar epimerase